MNFIVTLEDKETIALDALGELAQKEGIEASTIKEDATEGVVCHGASISAILSLNLSESTRDIVLSLLL